jgi:Flp pilus assembly protein TadD
VLLVSTGHDAEAIPHLAAAVRLRPDDGALRDALANAHNNVGVALDAQGRFDEAIQHFAEAVRLAPALVAAQDNLRLARSRAGRSDAR